MPSLFRIVKGASVSEEDVQQLSIRKNGTLNGNIEVPREETPEAIVARAREDARRILDEARAEAQEITRRAYTEGFARGYDEALKKAEQEAKEIRTRAREVLGQAGEIRKKTFEVLEEEIIDLAVEIAERLVARQLDLNPETVVSIAGEAIEAVKDCEQIVLYVNPDDVQVVKDKKEELLSLMPAETVLRVIGDADIERGVCVVETKSGMVDATLDTRWELMLEALGLPPGRGCL